MVRDQEVPGSNPGAPNTMGDRIKKQVRVYYRGDVQGVGFRFTADRLASELGLTGWVKNLRDGRVEIIAEGEENALNDFLQRIKKRMEPYITGVDLGWQEPTGKFNNFDVAF